MKNSHKLELAFFKIAAQNENTAPGIIGGLSGAVGGGLLGGHLGANAGKGLNEAAEQLLQPPQGKGVTGAIDGALHHFQGKQSIVPPGSEGWVMNALKNTGMTKGHGSKLLSILALLAPLAGAGIGGAAGMDAGKGLGNSLANQ